MATTTKKLFVVLSALVFSSFLTTVYCQLDPTERIADASIIKNLNDKAKCVGAIALEISVPPSCSTSGKFYDLYCTVALIGRKTLLSSASCLRNAMNSAILCTEIFQNVCQSSLPVVIMGMGTTSGDDVNAPNVYKSFIREDSLVYHPNFNMSGNDMNYDLVVIKLDSKVPESVCPQPFFIPSSRKNDIAPGPFMLSWGQPTCIGRSTTRENYVMATTTTVCNPAVDGFTKGDDQTCVSLQSIKDHTNPRTTRGDMGSPLYFLEIGAGIGNTAEYVLSAILAKSLKEDPTASPYGEGCSKTSVVPAADLLNPQTIAFLTSIAAAQEDIVFRQIPYEFM